MTQASRQLDGCATFGHASMGYASQPETEKGTRGVKTIYDHSSVRLETDSECSRHRFDSGRADPSLCIVPQQAHMVSSIQGAS